MLYHKTILLEAIMNTVERRATEDIFFGVDWAHWLKETMPNAENVTLIEGAKLFFPFERPK